jgi:hypothetical protein
MIAAVYARKSADEIVDESKPVNVLGRSTD